MFPALRSQLTQNGCCSTSTVATRTSTLNVAQVFAARRSISSTATLQAEADLSSTESSSVSQDGAGAASTTESSEVQESTGTKSSSSQGRGYTAWLDGDGARYRNPIKGRTNWLGETVGLCRSLGQLVQKSTTKLCGITPSLAIPSQPDLPAVTTTRRYCQN
jgi:hypothetical protein